MVDVWCNNFAGSLSADVGDFVLAQCLDVIGVWCNAGFHECWTLVFKSWIGPQVVGHILYGLTYVTLYTLNVLNLTITPLKLFEFEY